MKTDDQKWHVQALEALRPLRYHLAEMIEMAESHNRFADLTNVPRLSDRAITEAKISLEQAEAFFRGAA
jgi:hypothetical protein